MLPLDFRRQPAAVGGRCCARSRAAAPARLCLVRLSWDSTHADLWILGPLLVWLGVRGLPVAAVVRRATPLPDPPVVRFSSVGKKASIAVGEGSMSSHSSATPDPSCRPLG